MSGSKHYVGKVTLNGITTTQLEVMRNPRRFQHASSRWLLVRVNSGATDGFRYMEDALAYGSRLNRHLVWEEQK